MYKLFITLRYFRSRVVSYVAAAVLALGVCVLIIVTSVMGGFQKEFHRKIRGMMADVSVQSIPYFGIDDPANVISRIEGTEHVKAVAPFVESIVLVDTQLQKDFGFCTGVDPHREVEVSTLREAVLSERERFDLVYNRLPREERERPEWIRQRADKSPDKPDPVKLLAEPTRSGLPPVVVGAQLFVHLDMRVPMRDRRGRDLPGDIITLLSTSGELSDSGQLRDEDTRKSRFEVVGVFATGMYEQDRRALLVALPAMQAFMQIEGRISGLNLKLDAFERAEEVAEALRSRLYERAVSVIPWNKRNENLIKAVAIERFMIYFVIFFMMLLAGLCLSAIMTMSVIEKTRDLGILGAVGATRWGRFSIFLWQGGLIGVAGSLAGTALGLAFVWNVNWIDREVMARLLGKPIFDPAVYYLDRIPSEIDPSTILACVGPTIVVGFVLSLYPAFRAARLDPIEALRHE